MAPTAPIAPTAPMSTFHGIACELHEGVKSIYIPKLIHPFTCMVAGPTGSGKSVFIRRLVRQKNERISPPPERIVWCYSEWQPLYESMLGSVVEFHQGLPEKLDPKVRNLVVLDDLMNETDASVTEMFTKGSHHRNISVIYIVQNLFHRGKEHRTISLNAHYMVLFKNPRDASQINSLARQIFPLDSKYLQETYGDATSRPYGYLFVDLKQETQDNLRLRSRILERVQTVYAPSTI